MSSDVIYPRNIPANARTEVPKPPQFHIQDYEELSLRTPDEVNLHTYLIRPSNTQFARHVTILMFHGNAGNIGHRLPIAKILAEDLHCNVLFVEYRGYGFSSGEPNEKGLMIDAQTGLDYIRGRKELSKTKIVIYGQSLGGAVAIGLVGKNQDAGDIAGLVLENTFMSIRTLIPRYVVCYFVMEHVLTFDSVYSRRPNISLFSATNCGRQMMSYPRSNLFQYSSSLAWRTK
jgi:pimeloyl-ACP methyl ester carboxylesterase